MAQQALADHDPMVAAPGGPRPRSSMVRVDHGHSIDISAGRIMKRHTASKRIVQDFGPAPSGGGAVPNASVQWIVSAGVNAVGNQQFTSLKTTWTVPPEPQTPTNGQTIFLFNALQSSDWIYQPVLQWGASADPPQDGGGNHWSVASYLVHIGKAGIPLFFSHPHRVNVGDTLTGIMTMKEQRNVGGAQVTDWECVFEGIPDTCLPVRGVTPFINAVEVLEAYNSSTAGPPNNCSDYPYVLKTSMTNIEIKQNDTILNLAWTPTPNGTDVPACGQHVVLLPSQTSVQQVDLFYAHPPTPPAPTSPDRLKDGEGILVNQSLISQDRRFSLNLQDDGNLVLRGPQQQPLWASNTAGHPETALMKLEQGNLVLYDIRIKAIWRSPGVSGGGDSAVLQNDGNLVITSNLNNKVIWASGTVMPVMPLLSSTAGQLRHNEGLMPGAVLASDNGVFRLILQGDGNLVLYGPQNQHMWASNTAGIDAIWSASMQGDGNLVLRDIHDHPRWASNTSGNSGAFLTVQDDGNLVIYNSVNKAIWSSTTVVPPRPLQASLTSGTIQSGQGLQTGQSLKSADGRFTLVLQSDGNFVLYGPQNQPLWSSNTAGHLDPWSLTMQSDGNLVASDTKKGTIWSSQTGGHPGAWVSVQNDGNVVVYSSRSSSSPTPLWSTKTVVPPEPATISSSSDRLLINEGLTPGSSLKSADGNFTLSLQMDGNLVLYGPSPCFQSLWATNTAGHTDVWSLALQPDGNLVLRDGRNNPYWSSNTANRGGGARLWVQNDGNVVLYNASLTAALWSARSGHVLPAIPTPPPAANAHQLALNEGILTGQLILTSPQAKYTLVLQTDGNIVLRGPGSFSPSLPAVWASGSVGHHSFPWFVVFKDAGNLVAYDSEGEVYWSSNTANIHGVALAVSDVGQIQILNSSGAVVWHRP